MTKARDTANLTGSGVGLSLLDIDAGTDIGAALVDADLMIVDDGAGGTNRKATMARLATYMGGKITGGSLVYLASSGAISDAASVVFTQFDASKYDHYQFMLQSVIPATDNVYLEAQTSTNGGSNYSSTSGDYHFAGTNDATGLRVAGQSSYKLGGNSNEFGASGPFMLYNPHNANAYTFSNSGSITYNTTDGDGYMWSMNSQAAAYDAGARLAAEDVDAIKFIMTSGNIESGEIVMYGIANGT